MADTIVCATRAGEHSRLVHNAAFEQAKLSGDTIVFLHVLGGEAFDSHNESMQTAIHQEVGWLVRALVTLAQQRTRATDVPIRFEIREGETIAQMLASVQGNAANKLILGDPRNGKETTFQGDMVADLDAGASGLGAALELVAL